VLPRALSIAQGLGDMAEVTGLVLGALGIAGLFKSCIDNFDIVVRARDFGESFDLMCTEVR
jgi:hypothetical protein